MQQIKPADSLAHKLFSGQQVDAQKMDRIGANGYQSIEKVLKLSELEITSKLPALGE